MRTACSFKGSVAAVRMALAKDDICNACIEVEAYKCLQHLQGKQVPQLLGYGQCGQGFFVATSYVQVCACMHTYVRLSVSLSAFSAGLATAIRHYRHYHLNPKYPCVSAESWC